MSAWSVKCRRAPSRHCWDARVYGHTNTDMPDISTLHPHGVGLCSRPSAGVRGFALLAHENVLKVRAAHRFDVEIPFFAWCVARPAACLYTQDSAVQRCGVNAGVFVLFFCFLRVFCSANILVCAFFFLFFFGHRVSSFCHRDKCWEDGLSVDLALWTCVLLFFVVVCCCCFLQVCFGARVGHTGGIGPLSFISVPCTTVRVRHTPLGRFSMVDVSTVGTVSVPKTSALETSRRDLSEDVSFGID